MIVSVTEVYEAIRRFLYAHLDDPNCELLKECETILSTRVLISELWDEQQNIDERQFCISFLTKVINYLKPLCRKDTMIYRVAGRLVHYRINLRERDFIDYIRSFEMCDNVKKNICNHFCFLIDFIESFEVSTVCAILQNQGLMSALKFEEFYLMKLGSWCIESICQFYLRMSATIATNICDNRPEYAHVLGLDPTNWPEVFTYFFDLLSKQIIIPPTPGMLFFGRKNKSLASCYLLNPPHGSTREAMAAVAESVIPILSQRGGIGMNVNDYNSPASNDRKLGFLGLAKLLDACVMFSNSDSERPTAVCMFMEPWHSEIESFLSIKGLTALEHHLKCENIFTGLWIPDLLMKRYQNDPNSKWSLFDDYYSHLSNLWGKEFEDEYERLEDLGFATSTIPVKDLMFKIIRSMVMTGGPFIMFKDACNRHYYTYTQGNAIKCSNLCTEIIHHTTPESDGVCNLCSVNLNAMTKLNLKTPSETSEHLHIISKNEAVYFDFELLETATKAATILVNTMIDCGHHPTEKANNGAKWYRSMGIGIQGLNSVCWHLEEDLVSEKSRLLGKTISECMLLNAMETSNQLCQLGLPRFKDFDNSYYARGILHFDSFSNMTQLQYPYRWGRLRQNIVNSGLYNSQFLAFMPTVSSSQITECSESFYPSFTNLYCKITNNGESIKANIKLIDCLKRLHNNHHDFLMALDALDKAKWIVKDAFPNLPDDSPLNIFKTAFEYDQKLLLDLCRDRAPFVDHSQSTTLYFTEGSSLSAKIVMDHLLHAYKLGLKTGMYYFRLKKSTDSSIFMCKSKESCVNCE